MANMMKVETFQFAWLGEKGRAEFVLDAYCCPGTVTWDLAAFIKQSLSSRRAQEVKASKEYGRELVNWEAMAIQLDIQFEPLVHHSMKMVRAKRKGGEDVQATANTRQELSCATMALLLVMVHGAAHRRVKAMKELMLNYLLAFLAKTMESGFRRSCDIVQMGHDAFASCSQVRGVLCEHLASALHGMGGDEQLSHQAFASCLQRLSHVVFACKACAQVLQKLLAEVAVHVDLQVGGMSSDIVVAARRKGKRRRLRLGEQHRQLLVRDLLRKRKASTARDIGKVQHGVEDKTMRRWRHRQCQEYLKATRRVAADLDDKAVCISHDATRIGNPAREYESFAAHCRGQWKCFLPLQARLRKTIVRKPHPPITHNAPPPSRGRGGGVQELQIGRAIVDRGCQGQSQGC